MKLAYLASAGSIHTARWANAMAARGHEVAVLTAHDPSPDSPLHPGVALHRLPVPPPGGYFLNAPRIRRVLRSIRPDVLHVHYASGYGTLGRLSGFQPTILSVWGSDITEFARNSPIRRYLLKKNLKYPELLCATSEFLRRETEKLVMPRNPIVVTPFGVDCQIFRPRQSDAHANEFVVGTVKTLSEGYGIDRLLEAFALFQQAATRAIKLKLRIVGGGPDRRELERKAHRLGIAHLTEFTGPVPADAVPNLLAGFSVYVALSRIESFGLAVLEASAAGIPAIVSDAGGLSEVVADGVTGVVIPDGSPRLASDAMIRLLRDPDERRRMGVAGRRFVSNNFPIDKTIVTMEEVYQSITS